MHRRTFIKSAASLAVLPLLSRTVGATQPQALFEPSPGNGWRTFELISTLELQVEEGVAQAWLPLPSVAAAQWSRPQENKWKSNASKVQLVTEPRYGAQMLHAVWDGSQSGVPMLQVTSRASLRDRAVDLSNPVNAVILSSAERTLYTSASEHLPIDGIVHSTAQEITRGKRSDLEKARALYDWVVLNTARDPEVNACGLGDIKSMLETGNLKGKCADLNTLYVGMARAVGLPARDVYGIRVADSRFGYSSLGKKGDVSKAQHCRAEVFLTGLGWVAVDPADVRKVMLEEEASGELPLQHPRVQAVYIKLFGAWESNWLAYNVAHDVVLPGSAGEAIAFLMYPQGELADGRRLDSTDAKNFRYSLQASELSV